MNSDPEHLIRKSLLLIVSPPSRVPFRTGHHTVYALGAAMEAELSRGAGHFANEAH
jgi:hypothetical protein